MKTAVESTLWIYATPTNTMGVSVLLYDPHGTHLNVTGTSFFKNEWKYGGSCVTTQKKGLNMCKKYIFYIFPELSYISKI